VNGLVEEKIINTNLDLDLNNNELKQELKGKELNENQNLLRQFNGESSCNKL